MLLRFHDSIHLCLYLSFLTCITKCYHKNESIFVFDFPFFLNRFKMQLLFIIIFNIEINQVLRIIYQNLSFTVYIENRGDQCYEFCVCIR